MVRRKHTFRWALAAGLLIFLVVGVLCHNSRPAREMAVRAACKTHLTEVSDAIEAYRSAHEGEWPGKLEDLYPSYLPSREWLRCASRPWRAFSYLAPRQSSTDDFILVYDASERHLQDHGAGVRPCVIALLKDGRVVAMEPRDFRSALREQRRTGEVSPRGRPPR